MSQYFTASSSIGPVQLESGPIRKEAGATYSWIRHRTSNGSHERTVFIAVLPGQWSMFNPSHKGTPMFYTQTPPGQFPGIQTIADIRGNRRWVVGVLHNNSLSPNLDDFKDAEYFQCEGERRIILHEEFEAWQPVGFTDLGTGQHRDYEKELWEKWSPSNHDWRLWNSQNFSLFLAFIIIGQESRETNLLALQRLHRDLWLKQDGRTGNMAVRRHLAAIPGFAAFGAATFGVGVFAASGFGGYNILETAYASESRIARLQRLVKQFPGFRRCSAMIRAECMSLEIRTSSINLVKGLVCSEAWTYKRRSFFDSMSQPQEDRNARRQQHRMNLVDLED